jgi:hypothetical protein
MNTEVAEAGLDQIKTELLGIGTAMLKHLQSIDALKRAESVQQAAEAAFASAAPVITQLFAAGVEFNEVLAAAVAAAPGVKPEILRAALVKLRGRPPRSTRGTGRGRRTRASADTDGTTGSASAPHPDATPPAVPGSESSTPAQSDASAARRRRSKFIGEE